MKASKTKKPASATKVKDLPTKKPQAVKGGSGWFRDNKGFGFV